MINFCFGSHLKLEFIKNKKITYQRLAILKLHKPIQFFFSNKHIATT